MWHLKDSKLIRNVLYLNAYNTDYKEKNNHNLQIHMALAHILVQLFYVNEKS